MSGRSVSMTEGRLLTVLLRVAWPITVTNLAQASFDIVNAFWVGRLGEAAIAAVTASGPLFFVLIGLGSGLSTAGAVLIAQNMGARRMEALDHVAAQTLLMVGIVALAFTLAGAFSASAVLTLIGVEPAIHARATDYLHVRFIGMVPMFGFMAMQAMLQAAGEVRFAMRVQIGSVIANALIDPLLIFGIGPFPALGIAGAALATVIVQIGALLVLLHHMLSGRSVLHVRAWHFRPDWSHIRLALGLGLPASIEQAIRTFSSVLLMALAASFGTLGLAAYGVGTRPLFFWFTPMLGLSIATAAVVGQNIGAGLTERAEQAARLSAWLGFCGMTLIGLMNLPFVPAMMAALAPGEPDVIALASTFAYVYFPFLGVLTVPQALLGAFRGAGSPSHSMIISIIMQWGFQMPAAYLIAYATPWGIAGVWWSYPIANVAAALLCLYWFRHGSWRRRLTAPTPAQ
ncbi:MULTISPECIES: MATE family efflux transporter [unclassified Sphingobium]|uniref:MATE family efflux transporter n=1 Tax=unclassified Sphingobium TaxID=2611147 RepID=UPI0022252826|nr:MULTISPECIES: MATE family efflux transporter [unclassified Sphingobium]MCW2381162.1 putative MATE family efflux protein [Sphingobium sp. B2D3B]MCW2398731.1 putative MATE family efflux protein [Sphingobium sp. B2D3C]